MALFRHRVRRAAQAVPTGTQAQAESSSCRRSRNIVARFPNVVARTFPGFKAFLGKCVHASSHAMPSTSRNGVVGETVGPVGLKRVRRFGENWCPSNSLGCLSTRSHFDAHLMLSSIASSLDAVCPYRDHVLGRYVAQAIPAYAVDRWQTSAFRPRLDPRSFFCDPYMFLFRAHCLGSASGRIPTPGGAPPKHFRRHPASVSRFGFRKPRAHPSAPKSFAGPSENASPSAALGSPRLGSGDLSLRVARDRRARKERT